MTELKTSDYFIKLSMKVTFIRLAEGQILKFLENDESEELDKFLKDLGRLLLS